MVEQSIIVANGIHPDLARTLHALVLQARALHGDTLEDWVRRQRLAAVIYGVGGVVDEFFSAAFLDECRSAYFYMMRRSHRFLAEAERITAILSSSGIDMLVWRGAVYGRDLYGDAAVRCYSDLDILVNPVHQRRVLGVFRNEGYRLREGMLPEWFIARHHLHWAMVSPDGQVPIDVHWAVDHPYTVGPRVPVDVFLSDKNGVAQILLAALHVEKEARLRICGSEADLRDRLLGRGPVWPWLDLALMMDTASRKGCEDELAAMVEKHGAGPLMGRVRFVLSHWLGVPESGGFVYRTEPMRRTVVERPWVIRLAERMGCRAAVLLDWVDYLREPVSTSERMIRLLRVLRLAFDSVLSGGYAVGRGVFMGWRRKVRSLLLSS